MSRYHIDLRPAVLGPPEAFSDALAPLNPDLRYWPRVDPSRMREKSRAVALRIGLSSTSSSAFTRSGVSASSRIKGCADLLMSDTWGPIRTQSPIAYRNNGRGQFLPLPPERFWRERNDIYFGYGANVADVNGDGLTDFVVPSHIWGPDELSDTRDDFTLFTTLLNTTPLGAVRCE